MVCYYFVSCYEDIFNFPPCLSLFKNNARKFREAFFVVEAVFRNVADFHFPCLDVAKILPQLLHRVDHGKDGGKVTVKRSSFIPRYGLTVRGTRSRQPRYVRTGERVLFISSAAALRRDIRMLLLREYSIGEMS
jgi:hypothetical protein